MPTFNVLPLAPKSNLAWQGLYYYMNKFEKKIVKLQRGNIFKLCFYIFSGFTDEGNPCIMDSAGYIRLLNPNFGSSVWIQVCDSKSVSKGKSDHFFMVGANLEEFSVRCILVKGKIIAKVIVMAIQYS